jgi:hypothetical protein
LAKEWVLNSATNRWQLNFKRNVGAVSEEIRKCAPSTLQDWQEYYYRSVRTRDQIDELGRTLYVKITEVMVAEIEEITEQDCIDYMRQLVIERTFDGYQTEIKTIYGQLEQAVGVDIKPAPDEWDRLFNVDFFIERASGTFIGLQIKPVSGGPLAQVFKERSIQAGTHKKFCEKHGGPVFYVFSQKVGDKKVILNPEVIDEIRRVL